MTRQAKDVTRIQEVQEELYCKDDSSKDEDSSGRALGSG